MKAKTFKLKKINGTIHTYKVGRTPVRIYDNRMTEDFAIAYLTHGTAEQIESRKALFLVLPNLETPATGKAPETAPETTTTETDGLGGGIKNPKPETPVVPETPVAPTTNEAATSKVGTTTALNRKDLIALLDIAGVDFKKNASNAVLLEAAKKNNLV